MKAARELWNSLHGHHQVILGQDGSITEISIFLSGLDGSSVKVMQRTVVTFRGMCKMGQVFTQIFKLISLEW